MPKKTTTDEFGNPISDGIPSINDVAPATAYGEMYHKPEDLQGRTLIFHDYEVSKGSFSNYMIIYCHDSQFSEDKIVSTGAGRVMQQLKDAKAAGKMPFKARFLRSGRMWYLG